MNGSERTYSQLFELLRETPAASFTTEEIQSLIERPPAEPASVPHGPASRRAVRWIGVGGAAVAIALTGFWLLPVAGPDRAITPIASHGDATTAPAASRAGIPQPATHPDMKASTRAIGITDGPEAGNVPARREEPIAMRGSSNPIVHTRQPRPAGAMREKPDGMMDIAPRHPAISTLPMLELSNDELKPLGVTFAGGGIQTAGEEYYTIATAQDRATFATMGMDTTQRTGIVRMRLAIDTSGVITRKDGWTRVNDYSRIAPIIVLNSYVKGEHSNTVALSSFNRSPIMDSAKRSISSMVNALERTFTHDNGGAMDDGDQASPARILVPVHIRLGERQIGGSGSTRGADVILWYYPTPEFVAALPARYRISLQKELTVIADVVECNLPPGEACSRMTGVPLLSNYCKRISGALSGLSVSPNPAHGSMTMRYTVENQRTIRAALYGIRGEFVRELMAATTAVPGTHMVNVELGGVTPGAYVVVVRSDREEQVSDRLIVQ
ncbi:MAG: hypothetical protein JWQ98_2575 [Chlorobi bacterium]|nr:hypothetical protein [Chlorobiota bacterium]